MPCHAWKCVLTAIFAREDISKVPGYHLLRQMSFQWESQKLLQGLVSHELTVYLSVFNLFLAQWIMAMLSKACKRDNFEPHNYLKLSFTNIWGLCSNFAECESFLESNYPDILALWETNLDNSIDSENFSVRSYLPLIWKDSITHMHGFTVYVKDGLPFTHDFSLENSRFLLLFSTSFTSLSVLLPFLLSITFFIVMHSFWLHFIWHRWSSLDKTIC